ncbi:hypothetical protein R3P38DRAFT_3173712 [Favolaschia claudopus]|uniref:F-box domain-containing protein n=1 Tax=Favolaschia claudopus TaxID=2862362 RepID=A0AAW0DGF6_9AGAR
MHGDEYALGVLPPELRQTIVEAMPLADRLRFAGTSKKYRALAGRVFQECVADLFKPAKLSYTVYRFLQIVSRTVLSGSAIPALSFPRHTAEAFLPNDLDSYVPDKAWDYVMCFLTLGTDYAVSRCNADT